MTKLIFPSTLFFIVTGLFLLTSCEKDTSLDKTPDKVNEWIYKTMKNNYLWADELPSFKETNAKAEDFFSSLLSDQDGKHTKDKNYYYSTIEEDVSTKSGSSNLTYGFKPAYRYLESNPNNVYAAIKYVLPNSPAEKAGLKRGDWISHYDNIRLTQDNFTQFHYHTAKTKLTVGQLTDREFKNIRNVELDAAITMPENPILVDTILLVNNKKIAYLMYNSFVAGQDSNDDQTYNDDLRAVFAKFSAQNPEEFILDLRYNNGGLLSCAQLLATMMAPRSALGSIYCKLVYNETLKKEDTTYLLDENVIENGANLNLDHLYVITSSETASASELIINGLRPYIDVILIGGQTEGKNVGSQEFPGKSKNFPWILHPITCWVQNSQDYKDYENGFLPNINVNDEFDSVLGSISETMLSKVLSVIESGNRLSSFKSAESMLRELPQPQKGIQGIIID